MLVDMYKTFKLSLVALTLKNSSSSSRKGVRKSEGMVRSTVLAELKELDV